VVGFATCHTPRRLHDPPDLIGKLDVVRVECRIACVMLSGVAQATAKGVHLAFIYGKINVSPAAKMCANAARETGPWFWFINGRKESE
jgi:hypothetical protein